MTIAYAFGMMSRSYAIYRGVNRSFSRPSFLLARRCSSPADGIPLQSSSGFVPLVPYMKGYSTRLRANFLGVVTAQQQAAMLAARLDMALNNMSHGLCMLTPDGRLVLTNDQALKMFGLRPDDAPVGAHVKSVLGEAGRQRRPRGAAIRASRLHSRQRRQRGRFRHSARNARRSRVRDHRPSHDKRGHRSGHPGRHRAPQRPARNQPNGALRLRHRAAQSPLFRGAARSGPSVATAPRATA